MTESEVEARVHAVISRFVANMLRLARAELERELRGFVPPGPAMSDGAGLLEVYAIREAVSHEEGAAVAARARPTEAAPAVAPPVGAAGSEPLKIVARPAKPVLVVHAAEHVDRLVQLVKDHPWPPKSRELQILLGVKKDPFLRIVDLALAAGRIRRTGAKSGVKYFCVE